MKEDEIKNLFEQFEAVAFEYEGTECWSARELQKLLDYAKWQNFELVIDKAKASCKNANISVLEHFTDVSKMFQIGQGGEIAGIDILLTRYAYYLIAQNGDSRKPQIAFAQTYFAVQTRRAEVIEQRFLEYERLKEREKLSNSEKVLSGVLFERGVDSQGFAIIRSKGDQALFRLNTQQLKRKMGIPENRSIADFLPTISISAKEFAATMTSVNVQNKDLKGQESIEVEHVDNNSAVRKMLKERGITPENLPPAEDVKKVDRRLKGEQKKLTTSKKKTKKS
ncbi:MAG: DNA damage-inducible protein D [Bacteroidales bacterium]|jgi:DNA-damage-inducible protein D|nr:DNA damage-inducible protein D [Bacteroidales bacterium]